MKVSSILKLGGIVHNEAEETVVSNINSTNMATLESTSLNSSFFIEPTSQELSKKTSSVPENNLIMCQPSLGSSSDNNLITSQNTIFNDAHTDSINVVVTKENSMAENSFTTISTNSVETNLQDIPQIIV